MKKILLAICVLSIITACSNDNDLLDVEKQTNNKLKFHLDVKQTTKNIFELMEFRLSPEDDFSYNDLIANYDSIIWKVETKGHYKVYELGHTVYGWSQNFFLPGKFDTFLIGYKDDNTFNSDTTSIKITNSRDFLGYYWSDIKGSIGHGVGYVNYLPGNYPFTSYQDMHQDVPCVTIGIGDENETKEKILLEYITALYSNPDYTLEDTEILLEKYNKLFHYKKGNASPINIWITPASRIALLKCCDEDYCYYEVYAEPNQ